MSLFVDQMLVALSDPRALAALLDPPADRAHARMRSLFAAMVDAPFADIHDVQEITVRQLELARPLFPSLVTNGTWTQSHPQPVRTDVRSDHVDPLQPLWIDLTADLSVTFLIEHDAARVESIRVHELATRIRLEPLARFDPRDPANQLRFELGVALLIRDEIDVAEALRAAKLAREVLRRAVPYREQAAADTTLSSPYAPVVVFPAAALAATRFTETQLRALFAAERVVTVFATP
ncbi:hypothetical protein [Conexibacter woesei]|uniref:Uncharacterized protein n=1 Tax=Conexibacter woesei (strain DSM 14684 / CCUG 47730 / CIP 108061 / JCM 11494 / NBRC 100937 / ID131577) TaxID=469383 RepID=D3FC85_CONWI|nr:hypothetical protein [Conexibacter woesei]ADB53380.1 hypothetical protein Cwoe_4969 [Conexibacter woesei DSM 14684]